MQEYRNNGVIVPPPPPKRIPRVLSFIVAQQKIEANESENGSKDHTSKEEALLKQRCLYMTRYLKRLAKHPIICRNKTFVAFIQDKELPHKLKAPDTSAWKNILESLTVLRSRIAFKEVDPWFQTKSAQLDEMELNLRKLRKCLKGISELKVRSYSKSNEFRQNTVRLFSTSLFKERDLGNVINQGIECHKLGIV